MSSQTSIDTALDIMLHNGRGTIEAAAKIYGIVPALVTAVNDTLGPKRHQMGMCQVYFPWLQSQKDPALINPWVRWSIMDGGSTVGTYCMPQIGDEVIVAFEQGDPHNPYIIGSLWNGISKIPLPITDKDGHECACHHPGGPVHKTPDLTPNSLGGDGGKNKTYFWRSRTGNLVIMDDKDGTVRICDRSGQSVVQLEGKQILVLQKEGRGIYVFAEKTVRFDCTNFEVHASNNMWMEADHDWHIKAEKHVTMEVGGTFHSLAKMGIHFQSKKDINFAATNGIDVHSNLDMNVKASEKGMVCESGAAFEANSNLGTDMGTKSVLHMKSSSGTDFSTLMELNVQAGGKVNCKGSMIMMN